MNPKCSICGSDTKFMSKTAEQSKNGKAWAANICQNKGCGKFDFIRDNVPKNTNGTLAPKPYQGMPKEQKPDWNKLNKAKEESIAFFNAKNNAGLLLSAAIQSGHLTLEEALQKYDSVTQAIYNIGGDDPVIEQS